VRQEGDVGPVIEGAADSASRCGCGQRLRAESSEQWAAGSGQKAGRTEGCWSVEEEEGGREEDVRIN
jgi:hypothetical protein